MHADDKKIALRMIPYGLYVLTAEDAEGTVAAATVTWVTQAAFEPPQIVVGVKADSRIHGVIKAAGVFALNILGKGQQGTAYAFFKAAEREGDTIGGEPFVAGAVTGAPIIESVPAHLECKLVETLEKSDHSVFVGEVVSAGLKAVIDGRPDDHTLTLRDLGDKVFYGG